jgi:hypothetical protein
VDTLHILYHLYAFFFLLLLLLMLMLMHRPKTTLENRSFTAVCDLSGQPAD